MGFVDDNTTLAAEKVDRRPIPPNESATKFIRAADWNEVRQGLTDTRDWIRAAAWLGLQPQAADPAPAGLTDYVYLGDDGKLYKAGGTLISGGGSAVVLDATASPYSADPTGTDDSRQAIMDAAVAANAAANGDPAEVFLPAGTYIVDRSSTNAWAISINVSNVSIRGVPGKTVIKLKSGISVTPCATIRLNEVENITLRDLVIDGNWGNPITTIDDTSDLVELPQATINVVSTAPDGHSFPSSGTFWVETTTGFHEITYTGLTATSFTGCSGGTGILHIDTPVGLDYRPQGLNHTTQGDPKSYGVFIRGSKNVLIENCVIRQAYGDGIWIGQGGTNFYKYSRNVTIRGCQIHSCARDGIAMAQKCQEIRILDNHIKWTVAEQIDTEPLGTGASVRDVVIANNTLEVWFGRAHADRGGNLGITVVGGQFEGSSEGDRSRNYRIYGNTTQGGILVQSATDVAIWGNRIVQDWDGDAYPPIEVQMHVDDIRIEGNWVYRRTSGNGTPCITATYYGAGTINLQPRGIRIAGNFVFPRNDAEGIVVNSSIGTDYGGTVSSGDSGTSTTVADRVVTDSGKTWTADQWSGFSVRMGTAWGTITTNTASAFTVARWFTALGLDTIAPTAGTAYEIYASGGVVDVDNNHVDCIDDGAGGGAEGIYIKADHAGGQVRVRGNHVRNADASAIRVDATVSMVHCEITDNYATDNQQTPTCSELLKFTNPSNIGRLILRGNVKGDGVTNVVSGLASGTWLVSDGITQEWAGYGSPDGAVSAPVGSTFRRVDGSVGASLYTKDPGGWAPIGGVFAAGSITCVAKASLVDGETVTIGDGINPAKVYEFDVAGDGATSGNVQVDVSGATTAANVAALLKTAIEANQPVLTVTSIGGALNISHKIAGTFANITITDTVANAGFAVTGMSGGVNPSRGAGDALDSVSRDVTSSKYVPADAGEWAAFISANSLSINTPSLLWGAQDASGNLVAGIGAVDLTAGGTPHYQQAVTGWDRDAVTFDDGATLDRFTSASLPSPYSNSVTMLVFVSLPAKPAENRVMFGPHVNGSPTGGLFVSHASSNGSIFVRNNGQSATGSTSHSSGVHPVIIKYDRTNSLCRVYTDLEQIAPTYEALTGSYTGGGLGTNSGAVSGCGILYAAFWSGSDAEAFTDANAKALLQAFGYTISY